MVYSVQGEVCYYLAHLGLEKPSAWKRWPGDWEILGFKCGNFSIPTCGSLLMWEKVKQKWNVSSIVLRRQSERVFWSFFFYQFITILIGKILLLFDEGETLFKARGKDSDQYAGEVITVALNRISPKAGFRTILVTNLPQVEIFTWFFVLSLWGCWLCSATSNGKSVLLPLTNRRWEIPNVL